MSAGLQVQGFQAQVDDHSGQEHLSAIIGYQVRNHIHIHILALGYCACALRSVLERPLAQGSLLSWNLTHPLVTTRSVIQTSRSTNIPASQSNNSRSELCDASCTCALGGYLGQHYLSSLSLSYDGLSARPSCINTDPLLQVSVPSQFHVSSEPSYDFDQSHHTSFIGLPLTTLLSLLVPLLTRTCKPQDAHARLAAHNHAKLIAAANQQNTHPLPSPYSSNLPVLTTSSRIHPIICILVSHTLVRFIVPQTLTVTRKR